MIRHEGIMKHIKVWDGISEVGTAIVKLHEDTERVPIRKGVRPGDAVSPKLLIGCVHEFFKKP